ncbi:MAG: hypothetical protein PSV24_03755 [Rhodoferax sp.]|nr:hypothetical protein [Rhodoferax sp.]
MTQSPRLSADAACRLCGALLQNFLLLVDPQPQGISRAMRFAEVKAEAAQLIQVLADGGHVAKRIARLIGAKRIARLIGKPP